VFLFPPPPPPEHGLDVTLVLDDGEKIPAHRAILCCRSEYFAAMLERDFAESKSREIAIHDVTRPVMQIILQYLYTDAAYIPADDLIGVFLVADKFNITQIRNQALEELGYCTSCSSHYIALPYHSRVTANIILCP